MADPSSVSGRRGLVDQAQFLRAAQAIKQACGILCNPASGQQQILTSATVIAKHTSALCNSCRVASSKTSNPVAKKQFIQSAKDVANATATLVKEVNLITKINFWLLFQKMIIYGYIYFLKWSSEVTKSMKLLRDDWLIPSFLQVDFIQFSGVCNYF